MQMIVKSYLIHSKTLLYWFSEELVCSQLFKFVELFPCFKSVIHLDPMKMCIREQEEIIKGAFKNPVEFIEAYKKMYNKQSIVPVKLQLSEIPYYCIFQKELLEGVLEVVQRKVICPDYLCNLEEALYDFQESEFIDLSFLTSTKLILIKGIAILMDRIDQEMKSYDFTNINLFFKYNSSPIDLTKHLSLYLENSWVHFSELIVKLKELREAIDLINYKLDGIELSRMSEEPELLARINISVIFLGEERKVNYDYLIVCESLRLNLETKAKNMEQNEGFMYIMGFISEYLTSGMSDDALLENLKIFAYSLIDTQSQQPSLQ